MPSRRSHLGALVGTFVLGALCARQSTADDSLAVQRAELYAAYAQQLEQLAVWCDDHDQAGGARQARAWLPERKPDRSYFYVLSELRATNAPPAAEGEERQAFEARFQALRAAQAEALWALAKRAAAERQTALVYELATEAAREDAAFKPAWRFLGFIQYKDGWHTPFEIKQLGAGKVWHEKFGWLPKAHVARYDRGQRFCRNRWVSTAEEVQLRSQIADGWQVETEHFKVTTNDSLEQGVVLAQRLERLHSIWQQVFAGYSVAPSELVQRVAKGEPSRAREQQKHNVVYFRTRDEYNEALRSRQPQIEITLGIYLGRGRTAYFFAGPDQEPGTLFHEATHQLFQETRPVSKAVGQEHNFWIIEAIACYMESLTVYDGYLTLGGPDDGRLPAARQRLLHDDFYVPLAELVGLGMQDLQARGDIRRLYSELAGLAAFLTSRYTEATVGYLEAVYAGRADRDTLARLTGRDYPSLDREYREFFSALKTSAAAPVTVRRFVRRPAACP